MDDLIEYRVTFGVQYNSRNPHPAGWPNGNGWWAVHAENESAARTLVSNTLGDRWAFIYPPNNPGYPTKDLYPLGELKNTIVRRVDNVEG